MQRFFPPVEKHLLASYARWAGGQAARAEASGIERHHLFGLFLASSVLLAPFAGDGQVIRFLRKHFEEGCRRALGGQAPGAPCG